MNLYPVTVIENFYENPDAIRKFALAQHYTFCHEVENIDYVYPGCRTKDLSYLDTLLFEKICKKLVSVFHNSEHDHMRWLITTSFQSVAAQYGEGVIHTDNNTIFAAVLYLTPDAPLNSGTSLFKPNKNLRASSRGRRRRSSRARSCGTCSRQRTRQPRPKPAARRSRLQRGKTGRVHWPRAAGNC